MDTIIVIIIWSVYLVLLLLSLIYAGILVHHILKYRYYNDLPREQGQYAGRALAVYLSFCGLVLLISVIMALFMLMF